MNLPIKLVDLVTLLFLSLLVVIIIFIILQRNIKRFKLRNVKDPHFLTCKSIPRELREAIQTKHAKSHTYNDPPNLLTSNYFDNLDDKSKNFLFRMKAYETSKSLEYAICDFGYRRPASTKFEDFITSLINKNEDNLPKDLLKEFYRSYLWAMLDPMAFEVEQLRKHNLLINALIEKLAASKKNTNEYNRIIQHKLDLNSNGDFDFSKNFSSLNSASKKEVKFQSSSHADTKPSTSAEPNINYNDMEDDDLLDNKSKSVKSLKSKNIFRKQSGSVLKESSKHDDQDKEKLIMDTSLDSNTKSSDVTTTKKQKSIKELDTDLEEQTLLQNSPNKNDSMKIFGSKTEKIPLVKKKSASTSHQKKKSAHSEILSMDKPNKESFESLALKDQGSSETQNATSDNSSSKTNIELANMNKPEYSIENKAFNKTFDTNI